MVIGTLVCVAGRAVDEKSRILQASLLLGAGRSMRADISIDAGLLASIDAAAKQAA